MTWTTPYTWSPNELITSTLLNEMTDNDAYLLSRLTGVANLTGDITTTSTTFVAMTGASVSLTLASTSALVLLSAPMQAYPGSNNQTFGYLDVAVNTTRVGGSDGLRKVAGRSTSAEAVNEIRDITFTYLLTGLTPGVNAIAIYWRADASYSTTFKLYGTYGAQLRVIEL